jgi:2-polyprenyl-3-methyl-5-hydroxy-6-metoxy-1,4-benzoquinol methylase
MGAAIDGAYTSADHQAREDDRYAWSKYELTTAWLRPLVQPGRTLLNIGCGGGAYNRVATDLGLRVSACEPEQAAYEMALRACPPGCEVRHCGVLDLRPERDAADLLVMHDVLEHIEDDAGAAAHLARLLRPGGRAVISVPALQWLFGQHDELLGHYRRYTRRTLRRVLEPHFAIRRMRYFGAAFIPIALYFSVLARKPYPVQQSGKGAASKVLGAVCEVEKRIPFPLGTSLLAVLEHKERP